MAHPSATEEPELPDYPSRELSIVCPQMEDDDDLAAQSCLILVTPWTVAHRAPLSVGFSRQDYCSGLPCPPPGHLPYPGMEPESHVSGIGR